MRIGLIWVQQESNTFNPSRTTKENFGAYGIYKGQEIVDQVGKVGPVGGYYSAAAGRDDVETVPIFRARCVAGPPLTAETLAYLTEEIEDGLDGAAPLDGIALQLHGALAAENEDDADGHLVAAARNKVGPDVPIVLALDHHANITEAMVQGSDALVGHRTQPHDPFDTGRVAAEVLFRVVTGEVKPTVAWRKLPLLSHQEQYLTTKHPMKTWFDRAREIEAGNDDVVQISNFPMQPWLDVAEGGWSTVVATNDATELAEGIADELGDLAWSMREEFQVTTSIPVADAVRKAEAADSGLVVLSDTGDSVLGGAGGDSTLLLREMLTQGIEGPALVPLVHPDIGDVLRDADPGDEVTVEVGGSVARFHEPISLTGRLTHNGPATLDIGGGYHNPRVGLGHTAVLEISCGVVIITQRSGIGGVHPAMYEHFGIDPSVYKAVVVKTASNFQFFADMTSEVIRVNTPGPTQSGIEELPWRRVPRPIYPLDDIDTWR